MIPVRTTLLAGTHAAALLLGSLLFNGVVYQPHLKKDAQSVARAEIAARRIEQSSTKISTKARDALETQKETVRVVTQNVVRAIPLYLPSRQVAGSAGGVHPGSPAHAPVASPGGLPIGFGRLHDYAALGVSPPVPAPSGEPLGSPSGIELPALAGVIAENYGVSLSYRAEVMAWREWYREQAEAWPVK